MPKVENGKDHSTRYESRLESAFDVASGGIGVHKHAVNQLANGEDLEDWEKSNVIQFSCNFLGSPYVEVNESDKYSFRNRNNVPKLYSPRTILHELLFQTTRESYKRLSVKQIRMILNGEKDILSEAPINEEEFRDELLPAAEAAGLVSKEKTGNRAFYPSTVETVIMLPTAIYNYDREPTEKLWPLYEVVGFHPRFRKELIAAAVYKLGCMLAEIDQITHEALQQGTPVPKSLKPLIDRDKYEESWPKLFGTPLPTIQELYQQAHSVFLQHSQAGDPLIQHIRDLSNLPQLV